MLKNGRANITTSLTELEIKIPSKSVFWNLNILH
jgi:hypothetical protein